MIGRKKRLDKSQLRQIVLWIGANAGGVSKTTLAVHLGFEMARRGFDVLVMDLDTNVSMSQFCGLPKEPSPAETMADIFSESFGGSYPIVTPDWGNPKGRFDVCQGGTIMVQISTDLANRTRREYVLADVLQDHPLPHALILLDCPASLGTLSDVALAASTHVLVPIEVSPKSLTGSNALLNWFRVSCRKMRLDPTPQMLGFVPTQYNKDEAQQKGLMATLPDVLKAQKIHCYPPLRYSREFKNASGRGIPLQIYKPAHPAGKDFFPICDDLEALICGKESILSN